MSIDPAKRPEQGREIRARGPGETGPAGGVVLSEEGATMFVGRPAPDLAQAIDVWWSLRNTGPRESRFNEILPDGGVDLVFRISPAGCRLVLIGPKTRKACVEFEGASQYFGIRFHPGQAPAFLDAAARELPDTCIDLTHLGGMGIDALGERLFASPRPTDQRDVMEPLVRAAAPLVRDRRCRAAAAMVESARGRLSVRDLAERMDMHPRSLERLFTGELGMTPKQLIRLGRIRYLAARLRGGNYGTLADLAQECGYADQSHMVKDLKGLTGHAPGELGRGWTGRVEALPATGAVHRYRS